MGKREDGELPEGWRIVPLIKVAVPGGIFDGPFGSHLKTEDYVIAGIRVIRLENIGHGEFIHGKETYIHDEKYQDLIKHTLHEGDIIFSSFIFNETRVCIFPKLNTLAINKADCFCIRINENSPRYIFYFLLSRVAAIHFGNIIHGATRPRVNLSQLKELPVPLPPLPEQQCIAARLDILLGKLKTARARLDAMGDIIARFRKSVLAEAVSGRLTQEWREEHRAELPSAEELLAAIRAERRAAWEKAELEKMRAKGKEPKDESWKARYVEPEAVDASEISELPEEWGALRLIQLTSPDRDLTYGIVQTGMDYPGGVPTVRCGDVKTFTVKKDGLKRVDPKISENYPRTILRGDEVLVAIRGSVGEVAVAEDALHGCNISREVALIPLLSGVISKYLAYALSADSLQKRILGQTRGVAQQGINLEDLRLVAIPSPSTTEQSEIVRRVAELFAYADALEKRVAAARALADRLEPSILAKAFRGELSEQVPEEAAEWERTLAELEVASADLAANGKTKRSKKVLDQAAEPKASYAAAPKKRGRPRKK